MRPFQVATLLLVSLAIAAPVAAADFGIRAGRHHDSSEEFVGAELLFHLGAINLNPNLEYWLTDDITAGSANLDVTVDLVRFGAAVPYAGAGVGLLYADHEAGEAQTDLLGNLLAGVSFDLASLTPYAQVKYFRVLDDESDQADELAFTLGLRF